MGDKKKIVKIVELDGKKVYATKHIAVDRSKAKELDDLQWVVPHDHQETLAKEYQQQEAQNE